MNDIAFYLIIAAMAAASFTWGYLAGLDRGFSRGRSFGFAQGADFVRRWNRREIE